MFNSTFRPSWSEMEQNRFNHLSYFKKKFFFFFFFLEKESKAEALHGDDAWIPNRD